MDTSPINHSKNVFNWEYYSIIVIKQYQVESIYQVVIANTARITIKA